MLVEVQPLCPGNRDYRQRAGLAGAILHQPDILIMDEPTEGLDPNQRVPIRELIRQMGQERTVMLSTHVLEEVEEVCDRLLIIVRGKIVAQGTPQEIMAAPASLTGKYLTGMEQIAVPEKRRTGKKKQAVQALAPLAGLVQQEHANADGAKARDACHQRAARIRVCCVVRGKGPVIEMCAALSR